MAHGGRVCQGNSFAMELPKIAIVGVVHEHEFMDLILVGHLAQSKR